ncbi:MAG: helix-turn-helix transcriptional regulator [Clostridiales bacterium]|nr:helix-turn-helix transcriptional regulator [Clostridiales bacterium]
MKEYRRTTGLVIGRLREEKGMTQEVLSGLAGIARSHLGMIECGRKSPNVETLRRIAAALGLRLSQLIGMVEEAGE